MICEWCAVNAGRTSNKPCCVLRRLAQMPKMQLYEYSKRLTKAEWEAIKPTIEDEKKRLREIKEKRSEQTKKKIRA